MIQVVVGLVSEKAHGNKPEACYFSVSDTILIKPTEIHEFETEQRVRWSGPADQPAASPYTNRLVLAATVLLPHNNWSF